MHNFFFADAKFKFRKASCEKKIMHGHGTSAKKIGNAKFKFRIGSMRKKNYARLPEVGAAVRNLNFAACEKKIVHGCLQPKKIAPTAKKKIMHAAK